MINDKLAYYIGLVVGLLFFSLKAVGYSFDFFPGDLGDARFNMYLLEYAHKYFIEGVRVVEGYWNAPYMYPATEVIAYSDNLLGTFPIFSAFRMMGCDIYKSFQLWYISITILNYSAAYLLIKVLLKNRYAAAIGAFVFAFSLALQSQLVHAQTFPRFAIPLCYLFAVLFVRQLRVRYFFLTVFMIVYQLYCGIYLGLLLSVPAFILLISGMLLNWRESKRSLLKVAPLIKLAFSLLINLLLLYPLFKPYYFRSKQVRLNTFEEISHSLPRIHSYLYSHFGSSIWQDLNKVGDDLMYFWNHQIFMGGITTLAAVVAVIVLVKRMKVLYKTGRTTWIALFITSFATFFIFLSINNVSVYKFLMEVPGFRSMRALQRIINIELIHFALAVAGAFVLITRNMNNKLIVFLVFMIFLAVDNSVNEDAYKRTEVIAAKQRVDYVISQITKENTQGIISYEPKDKIDNGIPYQLDAMLAAQQLNIKSINGYSATSAEGFDPFWHQPNEENRISWLKNKEINKSQILVIN